MPENMNHIDIDDLHSSGLLWYINRVAFHPHGFALAVTYDHYGRPTWYLQGNGSEIWSFTSETDDDMFEAVMATFERARDGA